MLKQVTRAALVLATLLATFAFMPTQAVLAGSTSQPLILLHGFSVSSAQNCNTSTMWGTVESYFASNGYPKTVSLGFYNKDTNCSASIRGESSHCSGWYDSGGNDGTVNEDIRHVTCLLAWYIWDHYTSNGVTVAVVAHSMGGILIRQAMNDTPYVVQFPPYLMVSDVATVATPHQGLDTGAAGVFELLGCPGNCLQVDQMQANNPLMSNMNSTTFRGGFARNPQGYGGTDWTTLGSNNDTLVAEWCVGGARLGAPSSVNNLGLCGLMPGATHFVVYPGPTPSYNHGDYLTDANTSWNADMCYSDNNGGVWYCSTGMVHAITEMYYAVLYSSW